MNIEQALTFIAENEPLGDLRDGSTYCMYCAGSYPLGDSLGSFAHLVDCPWLYLSKTVKEDARIDQLLRDRFPWFAFPERRVK